jgi:diguanylate cyclase (GGDEF)-like protein
LHPLHGRQEGLPGEEVQGGVVLLDPDWIVRAVNPPFLALSGLAPEQLLGLPFDFALSASGQPPDAVQEAVRRQGSWQGQVVYGLVPVRLTATAVHDADGALHYIVNCWRDSIVPVTGQPAPATSHDALTGLPDRRLFHDRLEQVLFYSRRSHEQFAVILLGLDAFKGINDTAGHAVGDQVLAMVAQRFQAVLRDSDTVARMMGDEFGFIVRNTSARSQNIAIVAQKLITALAPCFAIGSDEFSLTASLGIAVFPTDGDTPESLVKHAYLAMGRAKKEGGANYVFYTASMGVDAVKRLILEQRLRHALEGQEFLPFYQPKVSLADYTVFGMETLLRWQQPGVGLIPPGDFIPIAEETGLIVPLGEWIMRESCRQTRAWNEQGLGPLSVAINLSARQFSKGDVLSVVDRILAETGLAAEHMELEITESLMMSDISHTIGILKRLHDRGIRISVDDFGTGYSSLNYLKQFPIDTLKIDRSFICDLAEDKPDDANDGAIVCAIISMAHKLGMTVVAEGIETRHQLEFLRANGCDFCQGYLFSRPLAAEPFAAFLATHREGGRRTPHPHLPYLP